MVSGPASTVRRKHANGWMTVIALCLLAPGLVASLYLLIGFPAKAQVTGAPSRAPPAPSVTYAPLSTLRPLRRQPVASNTAPVTDPALAAPVLLRPRPNPQRG